MARTPLMYMVVWIITANQWKQSMGSLWVNTSVDFLILLMVQCSSSMSFFLNRKSIRRWWLSASVIVTLRSGMSMPMPPWTREWWCKCWGSCPITCSPWGSSCRRLFWHLRYEDFLIDVLSDEINKALGELTELVFERLPKHKNIRYFWCFNLKLVAHILI